MHGGDDAIEGEKTEDELETANSDESENRLEVAESVRIRRINRGPSGGEGSRRSANTATTREKEKPTGRVEACGVE